MENRANKRIPFKMGVEISAGTYRGFSVETRDLSLGGLQVESGTLLPKGTECDLILHPAAGLGIASFPLKAIVARHTQTGMGLAFIHQSRENLLKLVDLLVAAGMEDVIQQEMQNTQSSGNNIFMM